MVCVGIGNLPPQGSVMTQQLETEKVNSPVPKNDKKMTVNLLRLEQLRSHQSPNN